MLARRETVQVRIQIAEAKLQGKNPDADSVIKSYFYIYIPFQNDENQLAWSLAVSF